VIFLAGLTILNKERCLGIVGWCVADPVVAFHLRNASDYRLPTFGPHGNKLGHSWYQWIIKNDFSGWFDNSEKGEVSGQIEWMGGWSCGCTSPKECCRLPPTYFWTTWHQTRAFLISVNNKKWSFWVVWQFWKRRGVWADWVDGGWSRGCTPPKECGRLPPTYFWTTWDQTRAFLISMNNKKWFFWLVLTILKKVRCLGIVGWCVAAPGVALCLRNPAVYGLPTFGPHGTKLGHSWYQW